MLLIAFFSAIWGFISSNIVFFACYIGGNTFPAPLSAAKEAELLERLEKGDACARDCLIEHNLRLVAHIAKKYTACGHDADDLLSIGTIGLIKGVSSYARGKHTKLSTFLAKCIQNEILMYLRSRKKLQKEVSLSDALGNDSEGNEITFFDIIADEDESVINEVALRIQVGILYEKIGNVLDTRESYIITKRYGLCGEPERTQNEIASSLGISRSYVSRIEKKALEKLRASFNR
ncbi:MAG: RNA polymerase sporulation sigma factor SigK [Bacillota bacterium]|nr:RNA polymerase sporulation sigma factor SigK [Bacillota bacterium]